MIGLVLVMDNPTTGSGHMNSSEVACFASLSSVSFPAMLLCADTHSSRTQMFTDKGCFVTYSQTKPDMALAGGIVIMNRNSV